MNPTASSPIAFMAQTLQQCARRARRFLSDAEVARLREQRQAGRKRADLAEEFGLSLAGVRSICEGRTRREARQ